MKDNKKESYKQEMKGMSKGKVKAMKRRKTMLSKAANKMFGGY